MRFLVVALLLLFAATPAAARGMPEAGAVKVAATEDAVVVMDLETDTALPEPAAPVAAGQPEPKPTEPPAGEEA